jgi:putative ABC transport system permease protein
MQAFIRDFDLIETMGMELVAGRDFSRERPADTLGAVILNETAARSMGWNDPQEAVDGLVEFAGGNGAPIRVLGVVKDFHSQSVHEQIAPVAMFYSSFRFFGLVRVAPGDVAGTIEAMRAAWERILPSYAFSYSFLDDDFARLYRQEAVLGTLLGFFAILTVLIACLGLFGLASFTTEQRTKEVGVRKVLGATVPQIVLMLSKDVTVLVAVAFVAAAPLAYYFMDAWLQSFAYHIDMPYRVFAVSGVVALLIAWATVGYQSIKAAIVNPVKSLRYE